MSPSPSCPLELLAPAKNTAIGMAAIDHGADAVYIGGPNFGARAAAGNTVTEIERLAAHAHTYHAQVFVALNTILHDTELDAARQLAWDVYHAGADALIVQDMGLLEMDLPPIALHASTQTDNRSVEKVQFLEQVGFTQIVLARELSLNEIRAIAAKTTATLEFFVHGALCVAFSGQCYISHAHTGRSANRGECSQACRLPYTLTDGQGDIISANRHLLSVKDNNQSANLAALADAGVRSFKIEGRYKELAYVKNVTAHYRQLLDAVIAADSRYCAASHGHCAYTFTPRPEKTFNRGTTDYFVHERRPGIEAFDSPAYLGAAAGVVTELDPQQRRFAVQTRTELHNGDGLSWQISDGGVAGVRLNRVDSAETPDSATVWVYLADDLPEALQTGLRVYRNHDQVFMRALEKASADRRIAVHFTVHDAVDTVNALQLTVHDDFGQAVQVLLPHTGTPAEHAERALDTLKNGLAKLGNTVFTAASIAIQTETAWFIPNAAINAARRTAIAKLEMARRTAYQRPLRAIPIEPPPRYPDAALNYLGNVYNHLARTFYTRHGVEIIAPAYEANHERGEVSLMITKHCLRYSFNLCPKEVKGLRADPLLLQNGKEQLTLRFDCQRCEMHVMGQMKKAVWHPAGAPVQLGTLS